MPVESIEGRIPRSSNWSPRSGDARREGKRSPKLTHTKEHKGGAEVPMVSQLLQVFYQELCQDRSSLAPTSQKERKVKMGGKASRSVPKVKGDVYYRACLGHPRLG